MSKHKLLASPLSDKLSQLYDQYKALSFILDSVKEALAECEYEYDSPKTGTEAMQNILAWMNSVNEQLVNLRAATDELNNQLYLEQLKQTLDNNQALVDDSYSED